ncbi:MAG: methyltransferase domain-containing protein [Betaproteobacteria bacterium]|nr:methyltransferase domain-containing protein [Betaproteobacteria bacterium]
MPLRGPGLAMLKRPRRWPTGKQAAVAVSEEGGVRFLHIGGDAVQSAMRLSTPDRLELHYTRVMMGFLLFHPKPTRVLMIGLGGGSMARFLHQAHPRAQVIALDVSREVVAAARRHFDFPADDAHLSVVLEDGGNWVPAHPASADVILLDAFEDGDQVPALCTESFYAAARAALTEPGVLVQNFMADDNRLDRRIACMGAAFGREAILLQAADGVNMIAMAFRGGPSRVSWKELRTRADALGERHDLPGDHYLASLRKLNGGTEDYLIL